MKSFTIKLEPASSMQEISERILRAVKTGIPDVAEDQMSCSTVESMMSAFSLSTLEILTALIHHKPNSIKELAQILNKDLGNVSKDVKLLHITQMIDLKHDKNDGRVIRPVAKYNRIIFDLSPPMKKTTKKTMTKID